MAAKVPGKRGEVALVAALLLILCGELLLSVRRESQTIDESAHLYAGYSYWKTGDFGVNPEHPPLVKLLAALPLLPLKLEAPPLPDRNFRAAAAEGGLRFLYSTDAGAVLFRARAAVSLLVVILALLVFAAGREMFGPGAGLCALAVLVFEPNILGNGPLVATDLGASCGVFAAVYGFYRYCRRPSVARLLVCGLAGGLALAAKHSALLLFPMLAFLAAAEFSRRPASLLRLAGALAATAALSVGILWGFYGFRYEARPGDLAMNPPTVEYLQNVPHRMESGPLQFLAEQHWLPEAYLYGLADIAILSQGGRPMFLLGRLFPRGRWFYFPAAFAIKSTLGFLLLLALLAVVGVRWRSDRRQELWFLLAPPLLWFAAAMPSRMDIGLRHVLPVYPFLAVLAGAVACALAGRSRRWGYVAMAALALHIGSSLKAFPDYLPYSNEIWGGPSQTHKVLADSNVGWGGGLQALAEYLNSRHIAHCWLAYEGSGNPDYYHLPCAGLPAVVGQLFGYHHPPVPEEIQGPVFLSALALTGFDWGPEELNPYRQFTRLQPSAVLEGEILRFDGAFRIPEIAGASHYLAANQLFRGGDREGALSEARTAAELAPNLLPAHELASFLYAQRQQWDDARREYQAALHVYQTVQPDFTQLAPPPRDPLAR